MPGQRPADELSDAVDVGLGVDSVGVDGQLRRGEPFGAESAPEPGAVGVGGLTSRASAQAPVRHGPPTVQVKDVVGFEVAVDPSSFVWFPQAGTDGGDEVTQHLFATQLRGERLRGVFDQRHDEPVVGGAEVQDRHDVRMAAE